MTPYWELILITAVTISAWLLGRITQSRQMSQSGWHPDKDYFQGLAFLLEDKTDESISALIRSLEINPDTIDTHLALGSLFRKRGETDKALMVHQNIFGRADIPKHISQQIQLELARDYADSGLLGRAEALYLDLVDPVTEQRDTALSELITLYEKEKEWQKAIEAAEQLGRRLSDRHRVGLSHYYCELADLLLAKGEKLAAKKRIKQAISAHRSNARAYLMMAKLDLEDQEYKYAFKQCRRALEGAPRFASEILPLMQQIALEGGSEDKLHHYLENLPDTLDTPSVHLALAELIRQKDQNQATEYLLAKQHEVPSRKVIYKLLDWNSYNASKVQLILAEWLKNLEKSQPPHQCQQCGFEARVLTWQCPSCQGWETLQDREDRPALRRYVR